MCDAEGEGRCFQSTEVVLSSSGLQLCLQLVLLFHVYPPFPCSLFSWQVYNSGLFSGIRYSSYLFYQRVRINKSTCPEGCKGNPACQATLSSRSRSHLSPAEERWLGHHLPRFPPGTGTAPGECVTDGVGRGWWGAGQAGVSSEELPGTGSTGPAMDDRQASLPLKNSPMVSSCKPKRTRVNCFHSK